MRTRRSGFEPVGEKLGFVRYLPVTEFHEADDVRRPAVVGQYEFADPEIAAADNAPNREALLVGLDGSAFLDMAPAADPLARLRIIEYGILAVDIVLGLEIVGVGSSPMPL